MFERSTGRFRASLARLTGRKDDETADAYGWQVERARFGRRIYRDPRFAALPCPELEDLAADLVLLGGDR